MLISGLYTGWLTGTTTVDFGPGITLQSYTVNSDTSITAVVDVDRRQSRRAQRSFAM